MNTSDDFLHIGLDFIPPKINIENKNIDMEETCIRVKTNINENETLCNKEIENDLEEDIVINNDKESTESYDNTYSTEQVLLDNIKNTPLINANIKLYKSICNNMITIKSFIKKSVIQCKNQFSTNKLYAMYIMYQNFLLSEDSRDYTDFDWSCADIDKLFNSYKQLVSFISKFCMSTKSPDTFDFKSFLKELSPEIVEFLLSFDKEFEEMLYKEDPRIYDSLYKRGLFIAKNKMWFYKSIYNINQKLDKVKFPGNRASFKDFNQLKKITALEISTNNELVSNSNLFTLDAEYEHALSKFLEIQNNISYENLKNENVILSFLFYSISAISGAIISLLLDKQRIISIVEPESYKL